MAFFVERFRYQPLAPAPAKKSPSDIDEEGKHGVREPRPSRLAEAQALALVGLGMLLGMSCTLFGLWCYHRHMVLNPQLRRASPYSPLFDRFDLDHFDLEFHQIIQNGSWYPSTALLAGSVARQQPNAAADAVWDEWEITRVYPITKAQIVAMGQDPSTVAKLNNDVWGLGEDAYASIFDIYHQIHCLNTLRKYAYAHHYNRSMERDDTNFINHCTDILLQQLKCSGNMNLIPMHWAETEPYPYPDMSIQRQCINFDKLTQWRKDNTIDMAKWDDVMWRGEMDKGPGIKQRPVSDAYYEFRGLENPNYKGPSTDIHSYP